jgi:hypothetical protein
MKNITPLFASFAFLALAGCSTTPDYDAKFGDAVREARLAMIIDPDAGKNADQALGMDGKSARNAILLYQGTFKAPPPVTNVINIGGNAGRPN